jgi:hypothetical protein
MSLIWSFGDGPHPISRARVHGTLKKTLALQELDLVGGEER